MFDRSWSSISAVATIVVLPLAMTHSGVSVSVLDRAHVAISGKPVQTGLQVATVIRPLDLDALTSADFGDSEHIR